MCRNFPAGIFGRRLEGPVEYLQVCGEKERGMMQHSPFVDSLRAARNFQAVDCQPLPFAGLCKLITDTDDRIIGCHLLGNPASEIIIAAGIAIGNGFTIEEFKKNIFPHPTVGEVIHESLYL